MKRLIYILTLILLATSVAMAQEKPKMLTFSHTVYYPGMNGMDIAWKAHDWLTSRFELRYYTNNNSVYDMGFTTLYLEDCPNFGISEFLGGSNSEISIDIKVIAKDNAYTIYATHIYSWNNPSLGVLYGENGQLYPDMYTKKQLKLSVPIIEYVSDIADGIFREFDEYMQKQ